jgi:hypothetical protein
MARNDLLDVFKQALQSAGLSDIFTTMADGRAHPECVVVAFGIPERSVAYYGGEEEERLRVTTIVRRISELKAMEDATEAERAIRTTPLDSQNGSYELVKVETNPPQSLPWDESGRFVWAFDSYITTTRKDFI